MNKAELIEKVARDCGLTKAKAAAVVDAVLEGISVSLATRQDVRIAGLGTFTVIQRTARVGRNPNTGESIRIAPSRTPRFRASSSLKEALAGDPTTDF